MCLLLVSAKAHGRTVCCLSLSGLAIVYWRVGCPGWDVCFIFATDVYFLRLVSGAWRGVYIGEVGTLVESTVGPTLDWTSRDSEIWDLGASMGGLRTVDRIWI
jgi:hypothetical protein